MIPLFEAAWEMHRFLTQHKIPYAIIGGFAVQHWGVPRLTVDVDLTVLTPLEEESAAIVRLVLAQFPSRVSEPYAFARQTRMILTQASNGRNVDISLGLAGYTDELIHRAVDYKLARGKVVRVCSAEDLVIHKCVAGRPQDLRDIEGVIAQQGEQLEIAYIRKWLRNFADALEDTQVLERFERAWRATRRARKSFSTRRSQ